MILITGAAGKTGLAVIQALDTKKLPVRAFVRRHDQAPTISLSGAGEVQVGDLLSGRDVDKATRDIDTIYHICPNVHPDEVKIGDLLINAAQRNKVRRFVYHSVLHPQTQEMPHHWNKLRVEEALFKSSLGFTILQPAAYMQNLLGQWKQILQAGVYDVPYGIETKIALVDLNDVAEVAAMILVDDSHIGATYELVGPEVLSQKQIAQIIGRRLQRPIAVRRVPETEWRSQARSRGLKSEQIEALVRMFSYYDRYGFWGNDNVLSWLLGRRPTSLDDFLRRHLLIHSLS